MQHLKPKLESDSKLFNQAQMSSFDLVWGREASVSPFEPAPSLSVRPTSLRFRIVMNAMLQVGLEIMIWVDKW
jgi:hypothetical protein